MTTIDQIDARVSLLDERRAQLKREIATLRNPSSVMPWHWQLWLWASVSASILSVLSKLVAYCYQS